MSSEELAAVEDRRRSILAAKKSLEEARAEYAKHANIFSKASAEKIRSAGEAVQLDSSKKWYNFWEKATRVPKVLNLSNGESANWDKAAKSMLSEVKSLVASEAFDAPSSKSGGTVEVCKENMKNGVPLVRVKKDVAVPPRVLLLTQIRARYQGLSNSSLLYMREHYTFRGGKTSLFHQVKKYGPGAVAPRDVALFQTWEEDEEGTITLAARSVDGSISAKSIPGAVRGAVVLFGMQIKPKTVTKSSFFGPSTEMEGSEVTIVSQVLLKGLVPPFFTKPLVVAELFSYLGNVEGVAEAIKQSGELEELINKFVVYPDGPDEDEEEAPQQEE